MNRRISCFVTRPANPEPGIVEMSTWCSAAILRTRGVERRRRRSSVVSIPSPFGTTGEDGAGRGTTGEAGGGAGAGFDGAGVDAAATAGPDAAGARWAAAEGPAVAAALLSVSITATRVWTGTVCPSCTLISANTPAVGDGISASTLSVEISNNGSS